MDSMHNAHEAATNSHPHRDINSHATHHANFGIQKQVRATLGKSTTSWQLGYTQGLQGCRHKSMISPLEAAHVLLRLLTQKLSPRASMQDEIKLARTMVVPPCPAHRASGLQPKLCHDAPRCH